MVGRATKDVERPSSEGAQGPRRQEGRTRRQPSGKKAEKTEADADFKVQQFAYAAIDEAEYALLSSILARKTADDDLAGVSATDKS